MATTAERMHAGPQFLQGERLDEIVVSAGIKGIQALFNLSACAAHKYGYITAARSDTAAYLQTVHIRQYDVKDNHVEPGVRRQSQIQSAASILGRLNGVAFLAQQLSN